MYENETYETIMQRMFDKLPNDIDKREGSIAYDMLAPKAAELAMAYLELNNVINLGFAGTTYGEFLDLKVSEAGLIRLPSVKATGTITFFSLIEGLKIPSGTVVYTDNGIRFVTDSATTIFSGKATTTITAEEGSLSGNVPAGSIVNTEVAEVTCSNTNPTVGGKDVETDEDLLARYYTKLRTPVTSGNIHHYRQWAKEISGIGDARVIPLWNGNGTVKVILVSEDKRSVLQSKVVEVANHIDDSKPIGSTVTVESAVEKTISVTAKLIMNGEFTLGDIKSEVERELTDYFKNAAFIDDDIKYSRVGTILLSAKGVLDYSDLKLNNTTANIQLGTNQTPVLGAVTLS